MSVVFRRMALKVNLGFILWAVYSVAMFVIPYDTVGRTARMISDLALMVTAFPLLAVYSMTVRKSENRPLFTWADAVVSILGMVALEAIYRLWYS